MENRKSTGTYRMGDVNTDAHSTGDIQVHAGTYRDRTYMQVYTALVTYRYIQVQTGTGHTCRYTQHW